MKHYILYTIIVLPLFTPSCKKFLDAGKESNGLSSDKVFSSDQAANAVTVTIYSDPMKVGDFLNGFMSRYLGLKADELQRPGAVPLEVDAPWYNCEIHPSDKILLNFWSKPYEYIYQCNNIVINLTDNGNISDTMRAMLTGEARFMRALNYFYLVNLFGDVPVVIETDYRKNVNAVRESVDSIWRLITEDLLYAAASIPEYLAGRDSAYLKGIRANRWSAKALLARTCLYIKDWAKAEQYATQVIEGGRYQLEANLNNIFLTTSKEAIFQLAGYKQYQNSAEATYFLPNGSIQPLFVILPGLLNSFESSDNRKKNWLGSYKNGGNTYFYPNKYKTRTSNPAKENNVVLRLAEMYLIRAEARCRQGNLYGPESAAADINRIRNRSGLSSLPTGLDVQQMQLRIEQEYRVEFFAEWGQRWYYLKRNEALHHAGKTRAEEVLAPVKPDFQVHQLLLPVPEKEIFKNPGIGQNPGF